MLLTILLSLLLFLSIGNDRLKTHQWGKNGHRIVGDIAADYLSPPARRAVGRVLGPTSMAIASTWMDRIKSDSSYAYTHDWHWVTIPEGMSYAETDKNPNGDLIKALRDITHELKKGNLTPAEETRKLKMLIHLVGDIHQPLHVGTGKDRGGNDSKVEWFYEPSNLHRVWDTEMIDETKLSYTEFSTAINHPDREQIGKWQDSDILDWAQEAMQLRKDVYQLPKDQQLGYRYQYVHRDLLNRQLLKAGVRLAGILNEIYG